MNMSGYSVTRPQRILLALAVVAIVAACGDDDAGSDESPPPEDTNTAGTGGGGTGGDGDEGSGKGEFTCGLGNGEQASGEPVKLGAIITSNPAADFRDVTNAAKGYFDCVNVNGGINGRPIEYTVENDDLDPAQAQSAASKLIERDGVVAIVGSTSIVDCPSNAAYYEEQGFNVIVAGVPQECFGSPNIAAINMGPHYSAQGAAEYAVREGATSLIAVTNNVPGAEYNNSSIETLAEQEGLPFESVLVETPISNAEALVLDLTGKAGEGGAIILTFTPPEGLAILQAAGSQGLIDDYIWASATPLNDSSVAEALGPEWDGNVGINAELVTLDSDGPDQTEYRAINEEFASDTPLGSFGQMGYLQAKILTTTLMEMDPADLDDPVAVNEAILQISDFETDILCKPWYYGELPVHIPNNWDRTVVPEGDNLVEVEDCFEITALDDALDTVREFEETQG